MCSKLLPPGTKPRSDSSVLCIHTGTYGLSTCSHGTAFLQLHVSLLYFLNFIPIKEKSIHIFTRRQHQMLRITKICRNTTPSLMNLETRQDSGAGKVISKEIKGSEEGEEMKDLMQACWGPHPEHAGTEAFPERVAVSRGPDGGNPAKSFQKAVQKLLGTQQGSSFQEGTGMFQRFNACLFGLRSHCVPGLPGATQQATRYKGPDGR